MEKLIQAVRELERVRNKARDLGLFVEDRELLECLHCGLMEDVTAEGFLITYPKDSERLDDSGLRFQPLQDESFQCPACDAVCHPPTEEELRAEIEREKVFIVRERGSGMGLAQISDYTSLNSTELGVFPSDWRIDRFDSLFDVQQGRQVSKKNRVGENQQPFLRTKNIFWNRVELADLDEMHFSEADESRLALKPDDLLICEGGDIGRTAIWRGAISNCYYQNHLHRARIRDSDAADAQFVLFWLWYAFEFGNLYFGRGNVTTIPNLSQSKLRELPLAIPPLAEQRKIAGVLGLVQRAMEQQERLIALTAELKKALLHQLFTQGLRGEPHILFRLHFMSRHQARTLWCESPCRNALTRARC